MKFLPKSPNLDFLKKEAKQLRASHRKGDTAACSRIRHHDTSFSGKTDGEILNSDFSILDAQRVLAREYGFSSWTKLKRFIETTNKHFNPQLHDELIQLQDRESEVRQRLVSEGVLYDGYHPEMEKVHNENAARLKIIIEQYGWPGKSLVGMDGCVTAWRIAQYAIGQPDFQKQCLFLLKIAAENGEAPIRQVAFLTDSILFHSMQPQIYGSIADWGDDGKLTCGGVVEKMHLNQRRGLVGLGPIEESLQEHQLEVMREGAKPPTNMAEYKKKGRMWAKNTGWI